MMDMCRNPPLPRLLKRQFMVFVVEWFKSPFHFLFRGNMTLFASYGKNDADEK
jgi:hypothetical protein